MKTLHVQISGFVQGVGFRYFVMTQARSLDLKGWVRNLVNGDVEVLAQGDETRLQLFLEHLRRGPMRSNVTSARVDWPENDRTYNEFEIR